MAASNTCAALREQGWRLLRVPVLVDQPGTALPLLHWGAGSSWAALPPDSATQRARTFGTRKTALAWAAEQAGASA